VREIIDDDTGIFIFCATNDQLDYLGSVPDFEVDMSYKRIKGEINQVIFARFLPDHGKGEWFN
jgi:hypothetical protein